MPRGRWCIFAAIAGLALLGAGPGNQGQASKKQDSQATIHDAGQPTALHEANTADASERPCKEGEENRSSDLCAQWKAADAAQGATDAAWVFGYVGGGIGFLTLMAAVAAAYYAKRAAEHAEAGANSFFEAERAIIHAIGGSVGEINTDGRPCIVIEFINRGRSAARIIEFGSKGREDGVPENSSVRWTTIAPDTSAMVAGFVPPDKSITLVTHCWIKYRTLGPKIHTSYFTVTVQWFGGHDSTGLAIMPRWKIDVSNPNGHPDDT